MSHTLFIVLSYAIAGVTIGAALVKLVRDHHVVKRDLQKMGAPVDERGPT